MTATSFSKAGPTGGEEVAECKEVEEVMDGRGLRELRLGGFRFDFFVGMKN
jgi:hypothetical protein